MAHLRWSFCALKDYTQITQRLNFGVAGKLRFFNMLLVAEKANTDRPPTGFCILFLIASKYAVIAVV